MKYRIKEIIKNDRSSYIAEYKNFFWNNILMDSTFTESMFCNRGLYDDCATSVFSKKDALEIIQQYKDFIDDNPEIIKYHYL